jgi:hypothetical protein
MTRRKPQQTVEVQMTVRRHSAWRLAVAAAAFASVTLQQAWGQPAPKQPDCSAAEYRQFDFKLGDFEVVVAEGTPGTAAGTPAGKATVESILSGCMLVEHWYGTSGRDGRAHYYFERAAKRWHLLIVFDDGEVLQLRGRWTGKAMVFMGHGRFESFQGLHRMTWSPLPQGGVRQFWEISRDNGATWKTDFVAMYQRRP